MSGLTVSTNAAATRSLRLATLFAVLCGAMSAALATDFALTPIELKDGATVTGTVSTDGTVGALLPENITGWSIVLRKPTVLYFDPDHIGGPTLSGVRVTANGRRMLVKRHPSDGLSSGGLLRFGAFGLGPEYGVEVANFSGYVGVSGGRASYLSGATFIWTWFNEGQDGWHLAARARPGSPVFNLVPVDFTGGPRMTGTITTDGSTGEIGDAQIVDWRIQVRTYVSVIYQRTAAYSNSELLVDTAQLSTDGTTLFVGRPGGVLGVERRDGLPTDSGVVLADFSASAPSRGVAGWFDNNGEHGTPLKFTGSSWPVAVAIP